MIGAGVAVSNHNYASLKRLLLSMAQRSHTDINFCFPKRSPGQKISIGLRLFVFLAKQTTFQRQANGNMAVPAIMALPSQRLRVPSSSTGFRIAGPTT